MHMNESFNLALDFDEGAKPSDPALARIFVETAVSFLKRNGATVLSKSCKSEENLRAEVARLREELATLEEEGARLFAGLPREAPGEDQPTETAPVGSGEKPSLNIDPKVRVAECMSRPVTTVGRNQMLSEAAVLLDEGNFRHLVVLDDEELEVVGILSKRQIALSAIDWVMGHGTTAYERMIESTPVKEVMETKVISVSPEAPLSEAAAMLSTEKIGCLPVMEGDELVGILTEGDFVSLLSKAG